MGTQPTGGELIFATIRLEPAPEERTRFFVRGDSNADGRLDIGDAIFLLSYLFRGGPPPVCPDAADADDSGTLGPADPIVIVKTILLGENTVLPPYPICRLDLTEDELICTEGHPPCLD